MQQQHIFERWLRGPEMIASIWIVIIFTAVFSLLVDSKLNAVTDEHPDYVTKLYFEEGSAAPPSALDPTTEDASARLRICDEISQSGVFKDQSLEPVNMSEVYDELQKPMHRDIFQDLYSRTSTEDGDHSFAYSNPYVRQEFMLWSPHSNNDDYENRFFVRKSEYVFQCLLKQADDYVISDEDFSEFADVVDSYFPHSEIDSYVDFDGIDFTDGEENSDEGGLGENIMFIPFFVTKGYDLHRGLHAHRYVLPGWHTTSMMLAEESAVVYKRPDFNVELHYLELRKHHTTASSLDNDPVCKLNQGDFHDENLIFRLCAIVLTSPPFNERLLYPRQVFNNISFRKTVAFRTEAAKLGAANKSYYENMLECTAKTTFGVPQIFYISRAYNPYQVFVYIRHPSDGNKVYLENLVSDVSIVHERYDFNKVEI